MNRVPHLLAELSQVVLLNSLGRGIDSGIREDSYRLVVPNIDIVD